MLVLKSNIAISDSGFIFNPQNGETFKVNPIGLQVIKMLQAKKNKEEIIEAMILEYDISDEVFERYYNDFIRSLEHEDLIEKI